MPSVMTCAVNVIRVLFGKRKRKMKHGLRLVIVLDFVLVSEGLNYQVGRQGLHLRIKETWSFLGGFSGRDGLK